jgi:hypothetical protein
MRNHYNEFTAFLDEHSAVLSESFRRDLLNRLAAAMEDAYQRGSAPDPDPNLQVRTEEVDLDLMGAEFSVRTTNILFNIGIRHASSLRALAESGDLETVVKWHLQKVARRRNRAAGGDWMTPTEVNRLTTKVLAEVAEWLSELSAGDSSVS